MLNETIIQELVTAKRPYKVSDKDGLYLFVNINGGKYWRYDYTYLGKRKTLSIGTWPKISLKLARLHLHQAKCMLANKEDPCLHKKIKKEENRIKKPVPIPTFERVALKWYAHWKHGKNEHYAADTLYRLRTLIFPAIGKIPIAELKFSHVRELIAKLVEKGVFDIAKRTLQKINQIMRYAFVHEYITTAMPAVTPSELIPSRRQRHFTRIKTHEIPQLLQDIQDYSGSPITLIAIKMLLLTFVRTQELIKAEWSEIIWERNLWIIPSERMKMRKEHVVPLSKQAVALLKTLRKYSGQSKWLFPSIRASSAISTNTVLFALYRMGYKGRMTGHGFRGVASTALHEMDWPHQHIEAQLAHSARNDVSAAYNFAEYLPQRTKMMQAWSDFIYQQAPRGF